MFSIPLIGRAHAHSAREVGEGQTDRFLTMTEKHLIFRLWIISRFTWNDVWPEEGHHDDDAAWSRHYDVHHGEGQVGNQHPSHLMKEQINMGEGGGSVVYLEWIFKGSGPKTKGSS